MFKRFWEKINRRRHGEVKAFLRECVAGQHGTSKRAILAAAKERFGASPDWAAIMALIIQYLPLILSLL